MLCLNTNHLRNFRSDGLSQDKSCKEIFNQKDKENEIRIFLKMMKIQNFMFIFEIPANVKTAMQCFEILGEENPTNATSVFARLTSIIVKCGYLVLNFNQIQLTCEIATSVMVIKPGISRPNTIQSWIGVSSQSAKNSFDSTSI